MAEQMQARYPDHGDPLQKPPRSLEEPEPEKPSDAQGLLTMSMGSSPKTEIKSLGELLEIYPTLRNWSMPHQLPLYPLTQLPHALTISHRSLLPPVNSWRE
jgi:hypothetical protein